MGDIKNDGLNANCPHNGALMRANKSGIYAKPPSPRDGGVREKLVSDLLMPGIDP